jgi:crossover junction endodeoxyribonuclease RusA
VTRLPRRAEPHRKSVVLRLKRYGPVPPAQSFAPSLDSPARDFRALLPHPSPRSRPLHAPADPTRIVSNGRLTPTSLTITLPVPPTINHQYATVNARRLLTAKGRQYKQHVAQEVLLVLGRSAYRQPLLRALRSSDLALSIRFHFTSPLRRDVDGGLKIAQDALCEALAINDNRITEIHLYKQRDPTHPRIEVTLIPAPSRSQPRSIRQP